MVFCNCSMFGCELLCVHSSFAIISMGKKELVALRVFLVSRDCYMVLPYDATGLSAVVIVVFPDHTHLLFLRIVPNSNCKRTFYGCKNKCFHFV